MKPLHYIFILFLFCFSYGQSQNKENKHWLSVSLDNNQCIEFLDWELKHLSALNNPSFSVGYRYAWTKVLQTELMLSYGDYKLAKEVQDQFRRIQVQGQIHPFANLSSLIQPFFSLGVSYSRYSNDGGISNEIEIPYGVGIAFRINDQLQLFVSNGSQLFRTKPRQNMSVGLRINLDSWKDLDRDGVKDSEDACPEVFGLASLSGCPDEDIDSDGFPNQVDACPEVFGTVQGCPDMDGDGTMDSQDSCKTVPGKLKGCPDTDGDGFYDKIDKCPDQAGPQEGCPALLVQFENKEDSVLINATSGQRVKQSVEMKSQSESKTNQSARLAGITPGLNVTASNSIDEIQQSSQSNLEVKKEQLKGGGLPSNQQNSSVQNSTSASIKENKDPVLSNAEFIVYFESASSRVSTRYKVTLVQAYEILMSNPRNILLIDGHTDNEGSETANDRLSDHRAQAVKAFFINRGVPANRLRTEYFGFYMPAMDNNSAAGRAKNRRVELRIISQ